MLTGGSRATRQGSIAGALCGFTQEASNVRRNSGFASFFKVSSLSVCGGEGLGSFGGVTSVLFGLERGVTLVKGGTITLRPPKI